MVELTSDETDEILYLTRVNERTELETYLSDLSRTHRCDPASIIATAVEDDSRNTVLHYAAANGHIDLLTYILDLQQNNTIDAVDTVTNGSGATTQEKQHQQQERQQIAKSSVFQPLPLSTRNRAGNTPLHWASMNGHLDAVKKLHSTGAHVSTLNEAGRDALQEAMGAERIEVAEWLMGAGSEVQKVNGDENVDEEKTGKEKEEKGVGCK